MQSDFLDQHNSQGYYIQVYVVNSANNLLSRQLSQKMELMKLTINEVRQHTDSHVKELGCKKGSDVKLGLMPGTEPFKITTSRKIPMQLLHAFHSELEKMQRMGMIEKVNEPTEWCSPLVIIPKTIRM